MNSSNHTHQSGSESDLAVQFSAEPSKSASWLPVTVLVLAGCLSFLTIDFEVGRKFGQKALHNEFSKLLEASEHFGTPYGQFLILLVVAVITHWQDSRLVRVFVGSSFAGLAADVFKLLISRTRPCDFDFSHHSLVQGFTHFFPFMSEGSSNQSFPSAHTASAFGFAIMLSWLYPQARKVFVFIAILVAFQRIFTGAHFPSDTCFGAAVGWLVASCFVSGTVISRWWDRFEMKIRNKVTHPPNDELDYQRHSNPIPE